MKIVENKNTKTKGYIAIGAAVLMFAFLIDSEFFVEPTILYLATRVFIPAGLVVFGIGKIKDSQPYYVCVCPSCGQKFKFDVNELGVQCPKCNKRVVKDGEEFKITE